MKFSWMFGSSLEAHHLLYSYVAVWVIQGGYALWLALQWKRAKRSTRAHLAGSSTDRDTL